MRTEAHQLQTLREDQYGLMKSVCDGETGKERIVEPTEGVSPTGLLVVSTLISDCYNVT